MPEQKRETLSSGKIRLILAKPITIGSETIGDLEFAEPEAQHVEKLRAGYAEIDISDVLDIAEKITGRARMVLNKLSIKDLNATQEIVLGFLLDGLRTGGRA